jgi:hypothetical protein
VQSYPLFFGVAADLRGVRLGLLDCKHASLRRPAANYRFKKHRTKRRRLVLAEANFNASHINANHNSANPKGVRWWRCSRLYSRSSPSRLLRSLRTYSNRSGSLGVALPVRLKRERVSLAHFPSAGRWVVDNDTRAHLGFNERKTFLAVHAGKLLRQWASN